MRTAVIFRRLLSIFGIALIALGAAFWSNHALSLRPVHLLVGLLFVICLWVLVVIAFRAHASTGLALFALLWSLIVPALGATQMRLLPGAEHWLIQSLHLAVGLIAIGLGHALALSIVRAGGAAGAVPTQA
jgi:uncharacterized membrane protein YczE